MRSRSVQSRAKRCLSACRVVRTCFSACYLWPQQYFNNATPVSRLRQTAASIRTQHKRTRRSDRRRRASHAPAGAAVVRDWPARNFVPPLTAYQVNRAAVSFSVREFVRRCRRRVLANMFFIPAIVVEFRLKRVRSRLRHRHGFGDDVCGAAQTAREIYDNIIITDGIDTAVGDCTAVDTVHENPAAVLIRFVSSYFTTPLLTYNNIINVIYSRQSFNLVKFFSWLACLIVYLYYFNLFNMFW